MFLGSLLSIIYFLSNSNIFLYIYTINCIIIFINLMPFLKLDGYWVINLVIDSEDYMKKFKSFVFHSSGVYWVFDSVRRGIN